MQYILSEEEYTALKDAAKARLELNQKGLQELCTEICNTMPVKYWGNEEAMPWGCMLTADDDNGYNEWYCDECPVKKICPCTYKSYSK